MLPDSVQRPPRAGARTGLPDKSCCSRRGRSAPSCALWDSWKAGAAAARAGGAESSGGNSPTPWKQQVLAALLEQLTAQGLEEKARKELGGVDAGDAVEAITHGDPPEDEEPPWTFVLTFKPSWLGSTARFFLGSKEVAEVTKKEGLPSGT